MNAGAARRVTLWCGAVIALGAMVGLGAPHAADRSAASVVFVCAADDSMGRRYDQVRRLLERSIDGLTVAGDRVDEFEVLLGGPSTPLSAFDRQMTQATPENKARARQFLSDAGVAPRVNTISLLAAAGVERASVLYYVTDGSEWRDRPTEVERQFRRFSASRVRPTRVEFVLVDGDAPMGADVRAGFDRVAAATGGSVRNLTTVDVLAPAPVPVAIVGSPIPVVPPVATPDPPTPPQPVVTPPPSPRVDVPPPPALAAARKLVADVYAADLAFATTPERSLEVSDKLARAAGEERTDLAGKFALYERARELAVAAGDLAAADRIIDATAVDFRIDPLPRKLDAVHKASQSAHSAVAKRSLATEALTVSDQAVAADQYDAAIKVDEVALGAARMAPEGNLVAVVQAHLADVTDARAVYARVRPAELALSANRADPAANLTVGRFFCFVKDDWGDGLALLARGSDAKLRGAARADLTAVGRTQAQPAADLSVLVVPADAWWDLATTEPSAAARRAMRGHAAALYQAALPVLSGLSRDKAAKRLGEVSDVAAAPAPQPSVALADGPNLLEMPGQFQTRGVVARVGGEYRIGPGPGSSLEVQRYASCPCRVTVVVKTDSDDLRLGYGQREGVIFNWEMANDTLRFTNPATGRTESFPGAGHIAAGRFVRIDLTITRSTATVAVDGDTRATLSGDFAGVSFPLRVFTPGNQVVTVRAIEVTQLAK